MTYLEPFSALRSSDASRAGGKGASLGELTAAGAPVPPGFVILTEAWKLFRAGLDLSLDALRPDNTAELSARCQGIITAAPIPADLAREITTACREAGLQRMAVRSSATAEDSASTAWAGQLDTYLDVSPDTLLEQVRACWASLYTERALVYRLQNDMVQRPIEVAVVVQEMVESEVAGVGFSVHPTTQEPDLMMLQASFGLGEAVVSGAVNPDTWVISKSQDRIVDRAVGSKSKALRPGHPPQWEAQTRTGPCLTDAAVLEYARLLKRMEQHYGRPIDTEWARAAEQFRVVQARPITTLDPGYDQPFYDQSLGWQASMRRPWNLLPGTLFAHSTHATAARLGLDPFPVLLVELAPGMMQICLVPEAMRRITEGVRQACQSRPAEMEALLRRGLELEAAPRENRFPSLEAALEALQEAMICATQAPFLVLDALPDGPLVELARQLRSASLYPWYMNTVLPPLVEQRVQGLNLRDPQRVLTAGDLAHPDPALLQPRQERVEQGQLAVYQLLARDEKLTFHPETGFLLARLHGARVPRSGEDEKVLHGSSAYPGLVEGTAQVVLRPGEPFQDGNVLISVNANPSLMDELARCSAIVTDEGGASCHAAILARELKKPCVIGTGEATTRIRSGQKVRVDAFEQTVTLVSG